MFWWIFFLSLFDAPSLHLVFHLLSFLLRMHVVLMLPEALSRCVSISTFLTNKRLFARMVSFMSC